MLRAQAQEVQLGHAVLRQPKRLPGSEDKPFDSNGAQQGLQMILWRPPDPANVPPDPGGLFRSGPEVHLLYEAPVGVGDEQPHRRIGAQQCPNHGCRQLGGPIVGVALPAVLEPYRHNQRQVLTSTGLDQRPHLGSGGIERVVGWISSHRWCAAGPCVVYSLLPALEPRMNRRNRLGRWLIQDWSTETRSMDCSSASTEVPGTLRNG